MQGGVFAGRRKAVNIHSDGAYWSSCLLLGMVLVGTCGVEGGKAVWQESVQTLGWPTSDQVRGAVLGAVSHLIGPSVDIREKPRRKLSSADLLNIAGVSKEVVFPNNEPLPHKIWKRTLFGPDVSRLPMEMVLYLLHRMIMVNLEEFANQRQHAVYAGPATSAPVVTALGAVGSELNCSGKMIGKGAKLACKFRPDDFRAVELHMETAVVADTVIALYELPTHYWRNQYRLMEEGSLAGLNLTQVNLLGISDAYFLPPSVRLYHESAFAEASASRFVLELHGPCLVPFTVEKQTALRSVMYNLLSPLSNVYLINITQVTQWEPAPSCGDYIEVALHVGKYAAESSSSILQGLTEQGKGILWEPGRGGKMSQLRAALLDVNLVVDNASMHGFEDNISTPPLTGPQWIRHYKKSLRQTGLRDPGWLPMAFVTVAVIGASLILFKPHAGQKIGTPTSIENSGLKALAREARPEAVEAEELVRDKPTAPLVNPFGGGPLPSGESPMWYYEELGPSAIAFPEILHQRLQLEGLRQEDAADVTAANEWEADEIPPEDLEVLHHPDGSPWILGNGMSGQVKKGLWRGIHEVAIKCVAGDGTLGQNFMQEVALLKSCRNAHIVQFIGVSFVGDEVWLVMEYMPAGSLFSAIHQEPEWKWHRRASYIALDVAKGMAFLHSMGVIHLDLKSPNILLTRDGHAKVGDVGLSRLVLTSRNHVSNVEGGTFTWMAPEIIMQGRATYSADVFSFGVILWELVTGEFPQRADLRALRVPEECPLEVANLVTRCLSSNPEDRPTAKDIVLRLMDPSPIQSSWTTLKAVRRPGEVPGPPIANDTPAPAPSTETDPPLIDLAPLNIIFDTLGLESTAANPFEASSTGPQSVDPSIDLLCFDGPVAFDSPFCSPSTSELPPASALSPAPALPPASSLKPARRTGLRPASYSALPTVGRLPSAISNLPPLIPGRSIPPKPPLAMEASFNSEVSRSDDSLGRYFEDALAEEMHALMTGAFEHDVQGSMMYDNSWQLRSAASRQPSQACGVETAEDLQQLRIEVPAQTTSDWPLNPFAASSGQGFPTEDLFPAMPPPDS